MEKNYKKELLFKGNAVKRLVKEYQSYNKEIQNLQAKVDQMMESGVEEYEVNKLNGYVEESKGARNAAKTQLRTRTDELTNLINEIEDETVKQLEEYKNASDFLKSARDLFENIQE